MSLGDIFLRFLNRSITAGWLILAVLLLRLLFRKAPKWIRCLLWGIVAFRLICPFSIESPYSLILNTETVRSGMMDSGQVPDPVPETDSKAPVAGYTDDPSGAEAFVPARENVTVTASLDIADMVGMAWCCGMVLMLAYAVFTRFRLQYMVREAVCQEGNIYLCDAVASPFVLGMVSPRIYLPSGADMERMDHVIAHEQAHLKRKDHWWKPLGYLLLAVYWFQPLCWAAYLLFCKDIEFACDEKVISKLTFEDKKEYSKALLSCSRQGRMVMACPLAFGEISVKERIRSVLHYKKATLWILVAAIAACIIVGVCFLTDQPREYQVRITIPAGCMEAFSYSDEEICPKSGTLTVYAAEGLGDTEILLLPVESAEENPYKPTYITPGMPVRFEVERGAWYRVGVNVQNSTDEDKNVYVSVKNVDVRIASRAETDMSGAGGTEEDETSANGSEADDSGVESTGAGGTDANRAGVDGSGTDGTGTDGAEDPYAPQRYDMGDLDGNGEQEYLLVTTTLDDAVFDGHLSFYFNGESIYEYDDLLWLYPVGAEYIDLDRDGEKEIFFTFQPAVNSMPLIEYAVLKQTDNGWKALEMIHGETMLDNQFPISCRYGSTDHTIVIACEGIEKEIVYNIEVYYKARIEEDRENEMFYSAFTRILEGNDYKAGDEFGGIASWGIWEICSGTYEGRNCLIATHCLEGPEGKYDPIGMVDIYFDYDADGLVNIVDMEFRESLSLEGFF
ncbi:MAG: M56 family metallopeptidase [Eubacterium sp.]|nr:M56 family metallopeptidase [Eubacterium sp.]MCM1216847.1 M56 family metallopeptidase [Lachnospiraceae bacterium]MCM1240594.1 M56 family metallopeptidase [Lachnospiraceae bacterium]